LDAPLPNAARAGLVVMISCTHEAAFCEISQSIPGSGPMSGSTGGSFGSLGTFVLGSNDTPIRGSPVGEPIKAQSKPPEPIKLWKGGVPIGALST
jgi:hypothetical protein